MTAKKTKQNAKQLRKRNEDRDEDIDGGPSFFDSIKKETLRGVIGVTIFILAIILLLAALHLAGVAGDKLFAGVYWVVGVGYYLMPIMLIAWALTFFRGEDRTGLQPVRTTGAVLGFLSVLGTVGVLSPEYAGALGTAVAYPLVTYLEKLAALIILGGFIIISLLLLFDSELWVLLGRKIIGLFRKDKTDELLGVDDMPEPHVTGDETDEAYVGDELPFDDVPRNPMNDDDYVEAPTMGNITRASVAEKPKARKAVFVPPSTYNAPPLDLLEGDRGKADTGDTKVKANIIQKTLHTFGIPVEMDDTTVGPTVTRYAMKPAAGVRLGKITALQSNLELALAASPLRIEAPIPGKSLVGIEVPNTTKRTVGLSGLFGSAEFTDETVPLFVALGKDIAGNAHYANIGKMPHLLVAGTTGSGKSVMIHTIIASLLYRNSPERLRFIMIDPKHVELTLYGGIPHLLTPVITDAKRCILALSWAGREMDKRYELLQEHKVQSIDEYHAEVIAPAYAKLEQRGGNTEGFEMPPPMPHIVIVIDELSDIMALHPRELEGAIVRLAQKSRAVGIHLILSTQRPSAQVITGLIKANIPTRIALKVTSLLESRIILDQQGADKLLGAGDMLYLSADMAKPIRMQSPFLTNKEVKAVVKHIIDHNDPSLDEPIDFSIETSGGPGGVSAGGGEDAERDALYVDIKDFVIRGRRASTSLIQRRFKIGYGRAARIMDFLEEDGVIAASDGTNRPRVVLPGGGDVGYGNMGPEEDGRGYA